MSGDLPFTYGGITSDQWFDAFGWSFGKSVDGITPELRQWPDGKPYAEQDNITVRIFDILRSEVKAINKERANRGGQNGQRS